MSIDIGSIKRKLLIKYPIFGIKIVNVEFQASNHIKTAGTDGKVVLYNPKFLSDLSEEQQVFIFAHEIGHIAFDHIFRSEGKDEKLWNIATDAVLNALLKQDGLPMVKGGVDIPEARKYKAEEMYNKLLEEKNKQDQQSMQENQGEQNSQSGQEETDVGHDTHSLWKKAIEERKKEQQEQQSMQGSQEQQNSQDSQEQQDSQSGQGQQNNQDSQEQQDSRGGQGQQNNKDSQEQQDSQSGQKEKNEQEQTKKFVEQGEQETFKQNRIERKKRLQELSRDLANKASQKPGDEIQREGKKLSDIGIAAPLIDWRKLLRQTIRYDEEYTRKNARMRNGYFRHKLEQIPIPETEIVLDTSDSVSEELLKNFLRECKNIFDNSKVKVGCFNTEFHGFTELKKIEDIDNMSFPIGGGTDFNAAVGAFSRKASNKIIFTDGKADMPRKTVRNVIWVVFGDEKINPKSGKVIYINSEQLRKLYQSIIQDNDDRSR